MWCADSYENDPKYAKFFKMFKMHLPTGAVRVKMTAEGHSPDIIEEIIGILEKGPGPAPPPKVPEGPKLKDDPRFKKYFKMREMHIPRGALDQKMQAEGLDPAVLDMDPEGPPPPGAPSLPPEAAPVPSPREAPGGGRAGLNDAITSGMPLRPVRKINRDDDNQGEASTGNPLLDAIKNKAKKGLKKVERPAEDDAAAPKPTGNALMDQILNAKLKKTSGPPRDQGPVKKSTGNPLLDGILSQGKKLKKVERPDPAAKDKRKDSTGAGAFSGELVDIMISRRAAIEHDSDSDDDDDDDWVDDDDDGE